jgi:hypothetical protein
MRKEMENEQKVKEAKEKEMEFHEKVYDDMREKLKRKKEEDSNERSHDPEAKSSSQPADRGREENEEEGMKRRKVTENVEARILFSQEARKKRSREDVREREQVEEEVEDQEEFDEEGDLNINWIEFGMNIDGVDLVKEVNVEEFADNELQDEVIKAYDDVSGQQLNLKDLRKARQEEIDFIVAKGIWEKVPVSLCYEKTGKAPTSGKWVDVQKETGVRSRYVGRDFKPKGEDPRAEIFASMPPLEAKKILFSRAASQIGEKKKLKLLFIDIKKAHMNGVCKEWAFVEMPEEIREAGFCGMLKFWLYGMRPAARAWEEEYVKKLASQGYRQGRSVPTVFYHELRDVSGAVHGDDFTFLGSDDDLDEIEALLKSWFDLKVRGRLGPDDSDDKEIVILGRTLTWTPEGIWIRADDKHSLAIKKYCEVDQSSKGLVSPGKKIDNDDITDPKFNKEAEPITDKKRITEFRGMAAIANYLSQDRVDIQFAAKELCRSMAAPSEASFGKLKHLARYLVNHPCSEIFYINQRKSDVLETYVDSDWAGCVASRKSTSGGFVTLGKHLIKSWSSTQSTIALSSGEAEFYAIVEGASRALGIQALMDDMGMNSRIEIRIKSDSSAGRAISLRKGTGKMRHLQVKYLWLQDATFEKRLKVDKVRGTENPADVCTKYLTGEETNALVSKYGVVIKFKAKAEQGS